jgi:hypothetical protein
MNEAEMMKVLTKELVRAVENSQKKTLEALGARLSEVHATLNQLGGTLERLAFLLPVQHTAHLAMEALIKSMRGPHEAEEVAKTAWKIAREMHAEAQSLPKFAEIASTVAESTHAEEREESAREGQNGKGSSITSPVSDDNPAP